MATSINGNVVYKSPGEWITNGHVHTVTRHGAVMKAVDKNTGKVHTHNFNSGGSFVQLQDIISFFKKDVVPEVETLAEDIVPVVEEALPVIEELAPLIAL